MLTTDNFSLIGKKCLPEWMHEIHKVKKWLKLAAADSKNHTIVYFLNPSFKKFVSMK